MADEYVLQQSMNPQDSTQFQFNQRQQIYVADNNNGSYSSGQIQFDLQNLANSDRYIDWKSSTLVIPLVISVLANGAVLGPAGGSLENNFMCSLKNGVYQVINSLSLSLNNNEVISIQSFQNLLINYKILSSFSTNDVENYGSTLLFSKDTSYTQNYPGALGLNAATTDERGTGSCNNTIGNKNGRNNINSFDAAYGYNFRQNTGRLTRMLNTSLSPTQTNLAPFYNQTFLNTIYKNNVNQNTSTLITYHITATIPMRFLHDYFDKCPLMKNAYYKLTINTNTNVSIVQTYANGSAVMATTTVSTPFGVNPVMISPSCLIPTGTNVSTGDGFVLTPAAAGSSITTTLRIATGQAGATPHPLTQCRIYASVIEMTPIYESSYLSDKIKTFVYNDCLSYNNINNIGPNSSVNTLLTPGLSRIRRLLIFPFYSAAANGQQDKMALVGPMASPYASEPATCSPYCAISNFNVFLSGQNVYSQSKFYNFEKFLEETRGSQSINGGLCLGMSSGLISQMDHDSAYGFIVVDLSRHDQSVDSVSKSVQVQFTNAGTMACDYVCIIEYEKSISVDIENGAIVIV